MLTVVSVVRDVGIHGRLVRNNAFLKDCRVVAIDNTVKNRAIPVCYNSFIGSPDFPKEDWIAFVHEDFEFLEDPCAWLDKLDTWAIYGVAGVTESGRARLVILNSSKDGSGLVFSGCPYGGICEVSTVDCMCLIVHASIVRRLGLRFDENLTFDLYTEVFSADARERHGVRTFVVPIRCRHWSFGAFAERFYMQLEYVCAKFAGATHTYCSTTMQSFGAKAGSLDKKRMQWGRNNVGPLRIKMSENGVLRARFLGLTVFRRDYRIAEAVRLHVLVVVHLFYPEFWSEIRAALLNVTDDIDLFVTYVDEMSVCEARRDFPEARFVRSENRGFDVWPFLKVLQDVDISRYDIILKLHTKRDFNIDTEGWINRVRMNGNAWRRFLLAFVSSPRAWTRTRRLLVRDDVGLVADWRVIVGRATPGLKMYREEFDAAMRDFGLVQNNGSSEARYVAGTMFAAKPTALMPLLRHRKYNAEMFATSVRDGGESLAHLTERQLGLSVFAAGLKVLPWNSSVPLKRLVAAVNKFVRRELLRHWTTRI